MHILKHKKLNLYRFGTSSTEFRHGKDESKQFSDVEKPKEIKNSVPLLRDDYRIIQD